MEPFGAGLQPSVVLRYPNGPNLTPPQFPDLGNLLRLGLILVFLQASQPPAQLQLIAFSSFPSPQQDQSHPGCQPFSTAAFPPHHHRQLPGASLLLTSAGAELVCCGDLLGSCHRPGDL